MNALKLDYLTLLKRLDSLEIRERTESINFQIQCTVAKINEFNRVLYLFGYHTEITVDEDGNADKVFIIKNED